MLVALIGHVIVDCRIVQWYTDLRRGKMLSLCLSFSHTQIILYLSIDEAIVYSNKSLLQSIISAVV